jgi:S-(hydroxymethyl)mycothiol dehydrogenase
VVVIGLGPVGVMALQSAQLFGPARVLTIDIDPKRLSRAEQLGAEPIDNTDGDAVAEVREMTGGRGAESVIEAVGAGQTMKDALRCATPVSSAQETCASPLPQIALQLPFCAP